MTTDANDIARDFGPEVLRRSFDQSLSEVVAVPPAGCRRSLAKSGCCLRHSIGSAMRHLPDILFRVSSAPGP